MGIDKFSKDAFESALPVHKETGAALWEAKGLINKEYTYEIKMDSKSAIVVRSSVQADGYAADSGKDSIRAWIINSETGKPIGSKIQSYVARTNGWAERMNKVLKALWSRRLLAGDCPVCDQPLSIYKVKKAGKNEGRLFCKCWEHGKFRWMDEAKPEGYDSKPKAQYELPETDAVKSIILSCPVIKDRVQALRDTLKESEAHSVWAMLFVYDYQTEWEQEAHQTAELNGVGFSGVDAEILSSFCAQWEKRQSLSPKQMAIVTKKMPKYAVQIEKIMRGKLAAA